MSRAPLALVTDQQQQLSAAELVEIYLRYRLAAPELSRSRTLQLQRTLRGFAEVVGPTPVDADSVKRWVASRASLAPCTRYDEFCLVRACCTWLGDRHYVTPINWNAWSASEWPRSQKTRGHRAALKRARANEEEFEEYLYGVGLHERTVIEYVRELVRPAVGSVRTDTISPVPRRRSFVPTPRPGPIPGPRGRWSAAP